MNRGRGISHVDRCSQPAHALPASSSKPSAHPSMPSTPPPPPTHLVPLGQRVRRGGWKHSHELVKGLEGLAQLKLDVQPADARQVCRQPGKRQQHVRVGSEDAGGLVGLPCCLPGAWRGGHTRHNRCQEHKPQHVQANSEQGVPEAKGA